MIQASFFARDPQTCAAGLIGCELHWEGCAGLVVETEAYSAVDDEACHTFSRKAIRTFVAERPPGTAYVYLNYGMYWLLNVLAKGETGAGFVLIRALEPTLGLDLMQRRRRQERLEALCSGPGKLTVALGIHGHDNGIDLCARPNRGFLPRSGPVEVVTDRRIGITRSQELPWRYLARGNRFVSRPVG